MMSKDYDAVNFSRLRSMLLQACSALDCLSVLRSCEHWPDDTLQNFLVDTVHKAASEGCLFNKKWLSVLLKGVVNDIEKNGGEMLDDMTEMIISGECRGIPVVECDEDDGVGYVLYDLDYLKHAVLLRTMRQHNEVGCRIWEAALYLAELSLGISANFEGKKLLELGAGVGITGLLLAEMKAFCPAEVLLTDYAPAVLSNLDFNVALREARCLPISPEDIHNRCLVSCRYLDWNSFSECDLADYDADVIFAADCTYSEDICFHLAKVVSILLKRARKRCDHIEVDTKNAQSIFGKYPYALIACTLRNMDTFQCFLDVLKAHPVVVIDITEKASEIVEDQSLTSLIQYPTHILGCRNTRELIRLIHVTPITST